MGAAAWWRRAPGQRFNPAGVAAVAVVAASKPPLALPHVSVQDIRWLDWAELRRAGFRGVVFDKDNTLTAPYAPALWPPLAAAFNQCARHLQQLRRSAWFDYSYQSNCGDFFFARFWVLIELICLWVWKG
ncbi:unnamed protein product [Miscanthus lutarioriparius]|uniref:Uncharacterized protein n=1 Tax=Miscanthus lutarioriparius TaxID=422564 RepID=A0A811P2W3_9POAL|nr:unnamed protein product [Miscanthus lutarioriparius]